MSRNGPQPPPADGIHAMVPREQMAESARKLRDAYARVPNAPLFRREFGYYCLERWKEQGMPQDVPLAELFTYDPPGNHGLSGLGWCSAAFVPAFEEKVIEERGDECEVAQDAAGRHVLFFKGRRSGFMPEYLTHPVRDMRTWEENVKWRLAVDAPGLAIFGGIDKRVLAKSTADIDRMVERILPAMRKRGGYIPTCDHGVPEEVPYANYLHYRKRCLELGG